MATDNGSGSGIVLSRLCKSYGQVRAVRSLDLVIAPGETVALLGPNGAGKTTTIDMVLGLTRPDSGSVSLFGMSPAAAVAAGAIGGMLQTGSLIEYLSVRELVTMIASVYPRPLEVERVLRLTGAEQFADRRTDKLSGGQVQRVRFAVDVQLVRLARPARGLRDVLSYDIIIDGIALLIAEGHVALIETLGERLAEMLLAYPRVVRVTVRLEKLDRDNGVAGTQIVRNRSAVRP